MTLLITINCTITFSACALLYFPSISSPINHEQQYKNSFALT
jgi:hypothetical protein